MAEKSQLHTLAPPGWGRRLVVGMLAAGLFLVLALVSSYAVVPWLIQSQLTEFGQAHLGRKLTVGHVSFKPWALDLELRDLVVEGLAPSDVPLLKIGSVHVDAAWASLWRLTPVLDAVEVVAPQVHVKHLGAGRYDIDDLVERLAAPKDAKSSAPPQFALYNMRIVGGEVDFVDQPQGRTHQLRELELALPFLSNLAADRGVKVAPHLAFVLNGSRFDSSAESTPFAQTRSSEVRIEIDKLDLKPYLGYLPASLPVRPSAGILTTRLTLDFEQAAQAQLRLNGQMELQRFAVELPGERRGTGAGLATLDSAQLQIKDLRPLEHKAVFDSLELVNPAFTIARDAAGALPMLQTFAGRPEGATQDKGQTSQGWEVQLDRLGLIGGKVSWLDESTKPAAKWQLSRIKLDADQVAWPLTKQATAKLTGDLEAPGAAASHLVIDVKGASTGVAAVVNVKGLDLNMANPYLAQWMYPRLQGQLDTDLELHWQAGAGDVAATTALDVHALTLSKLALTPTPSQPGLGSQTLAVLASVGTTRITDLKVQLPQKQVTVGLVAFEQVLMPVERAANGALLAQSWLKTPAITAAAPQGKDRDASPWKVSVAALSLERAKIPYLDRSTPRPVRLELSELRLKAQQLGLPASAPIPFQLRAKAGAGRLEPGQVTLAGTLDPQTLALDARIDATRLPAHAVSPYVASALNLVVRRAETSFKGSVKFRSTPGGPEVQVQGDGALEDLRANEKVLNLVERSAEGDEVLSWKALGLRGLSVGLAPHTPLQLEIREAVVSDFYTRLILNEAGRFNLQDLLAKSPPDADAPTAVAKVGKGDDLPAVVRVGGVSLVNGKVFFSDRFVKPNYSADLSELTGRLGAFTSEPVAGTVQMADLELRGRAEGTATLEILGKLNPLANPLALDIQGKVRELELPPLSAYSVKYAGYGIERGKLSLDVGYQVKPDGQLTATNKLVLNSLQFGDKAEGATSSLPVKLAATLLADRDGVINLDLPISGSLKDPEFQLGSIFFKALGHIILKAITSPFSLLSGLLGGSADELSQLAFAPGSARLTPDAEQSLDKLAGVLHEKTNLRVTVVGMANLEAEREAYQHERLQNLLQAEKRRSVTTGGKDTPEMPSGTPIARDGDEYAQLLKRVYRRADMPKPRNLLGLLKDLPVNEMEALLLPQMHATDDAMRELAVQRGLAVKDYLANRQVPVERLFLGAAKTLPADGKWTPHASLSLTGS